MKKPEECHTIEEVRAAIDSIDQEIVQLLSKRFAFVKEVVKFKKETGDIVAQSRYDAVIKSRREWAIDNNLDPDVIEQMYRLLLNHFIEEEHKILKKL